MKLLEIIKVALDQAKKPLTAEAILKTILNDNLYEFTGKTPKTIIRARLSRIQLRSAPLANLGRSS